MDTSYTPRPWRIVDREIMEDGSVYPCHILGGAASYQVCTLESPDIAKHGMEHPHLFPGLNGVLGHNARLIAAAPDLLEALVWYVENDDVIEMAGNEFWLEGREKARAALAKARGE